MVYVTNFTLLPDNVETLNQTHVGGRSLQVSVSDSETLTLRHSGPLSTTSIWVERGRDC